MFHRLQYTQKSVCSIDCNIHKNQYVLYIAIYTKISMSQTLEYTHKSVCPKHDYLFIDWTLIAPSIEQAHLRAFHCSKLYISPITNTSIKHIQQETSNTSKYPNIVLPALPLCTIAHKARTCLYRWPFSRIYQH